MHTADLVGRHLLVFRGGDGRAYAFPRDHAWHLRSGVLRSRCAWPSNARRPRSRLVKVEWRDSLAHSAAALTDASSCV